MSRLPRLCQTALALGFAFPVANAYANTCSVHSPVHTVALIELYTSEGCSSCPPADRWLAELSSRFTAQEAIGLSLHVDYWNYIGWKDPFSQPRFSDRQRWLSQLASSSTIYTPEVFVGMKEFRGWSNAPSLENRVRAINSEPAQARIELQMTPSGANAARLEARFDATVRPGHSAQAIVVVYEKQLATDVRAGENRGAKLIHDNVVRFWSEPVVIDAKTGRAEWRQTVELPASWKRKNLGVTALVQDTTAGNVLQAVSMPGCV